MRMAVIFNGIVENVVIADAGFSPGNGRNAVQSDIASSGWAWDGVTLSPPTPGQPVPRQCSRSRWMATLDIAGQLPAWITAINNASAKPKDRMYATTGGETGLFDEDSTKLGRLAVAAGVNIKTTFDNLIPLT